MTANATVRWKLPTVREDGTALDPSELRGTEVSLAIAGAPQAVVNLVAADAPLQELMVPDLAVGDWVYQLVWIDKKDPDGLRSIPFNAPFTVASVPLNSPPSIGTNVTVTLS